MTPDATAPAAETAPAAGTAAPVVRFNAVHKSFGTVEVLKGISFAVGRGEVVCLIGRSGSGKSTALRCINGLERITTGSIDVCGHVVTPDGRTDLQAVRRRVGIVFQSYNLFPHLTVEQNITLAPRRVKRTAPAAARRRGRRARQGRPLRQARQLPRAAVGRPAAARRHRARPRHAA